MEITLSCAFMMVRTTSFDFIFPPIPPSPFLLPLLSSSLLLPLPPPPTRLFLFCFNVPQTAGTVVFAEIMMLPNGMSKGCGCVPPSDGR